MKEKLLYDLYFGLQYKNLKKKSKLLNGSPRKEMPKMHYIIS